MAYRMKSIKAWALALGLVLAFGGCSKKDAEEPASAPSEEGDKAAEPPTNQATEGEETPAAEPAPEAAAPAAAAKPAPAPPAAAEPAGFDGPAVTKYVTSYALKVRSGPGKEFPVKRHVKRGDKLEAVINGEWAKIGPSEYVSINRLSDAAPGAKKHKAKKKKK